MDVWFLIARDGSCDCLLREDTTVGVAVFPFKFFLEFVEVEAGSETTGNIYAWCGYLWLHAVDQKRVPLWRSHLWLQCMLWFVADVFFFRNDMNFEKKQQLGQTSPTNHKSTFSRAEGGSCGMKCNVFLKCKRVYLHLSRCLDHFRVSGAISVCQECQFGAR